MNASMAHYGEQEFSYRSNEAGGDKVTGPSRVRRSKHSARRRVKAPTQYNGMHRRRRKRISW